jgi:hypothetical protein
MLLNPILYFNSDAIRTATDEFWVAADIIWYGEGEVHSCLGCIVLPIPETKVYLPWLAGEF